MLLTLTQALQLAGLAPCLFVIIFLSTRLRRNPQALVPALYFAALLCSFALPLLGLHPALAAFPGLENLLMFGASALPAFSFLLIRQFMAGRVPSWPYWLVLAIPLGGSSLMYAAALQANDRCVIQESCPDIASISTLYHMLTSALVFLLLVVYVSRAGAMDSGDVHKKHKYWLVMALIVLHLLVLATYLARLSHAMTADNALFAAVMFKLTFIYLVLTSLFRVFYPDLAPQALVARAPYDPAVDLPHAQKVKALLEQERVYRQMRLNRVGLAKMIGIGEHHLSRVINRHFNMNFHELINDYRIEEAKQRLKAEPAQITTIGFEVGFNSIASFNRVFRRKVGVSPTDYRNKGGLGTGD